MSIETKTMPTDSRDSLILECVWEIDKMARSLPDYVDLEGCGQGYFMARAMAGRMLRLTGVVMEMFSGGDLQQSYANARKVIYLEGASQG